MDEKELLKIIGDACRNAETEYSNEDFSVNVYMPDDGDDSQGLNAEAVHGKLTEERFRWISKLGYLKGAFDRTREEYPSDFAPDVLEKADAYADSERKDDDISLATEARTLGYIKGYVVAGDYKEAMNGR